MCSRKVSGVYQVENICLLAVLVVARQVVLWSERCLVMDKTCLRNDVSITCLVFLQLLFELPHLISAPAIDRGQSRECAAFRQVRKVCLSGPPPVLVVCCSSLNPNLDAKPELNAHSVRGDRSA